MPNSQRHSMFSGGWAVVWCLCAIIGLAGAEKASIEIPFEVEEAGGVARSSAPVTGGIPFARDALTDAQLKDLRLFDESGASIPFCQTITARWAWPKGSIQWLLLDFQTSFTAKQKRTFTLKLAPKVSAAPISKSLNLSDGKLLTVDTGALTVAIPKDKFSFLGNVQTKGGVRTSAGDLVVDLVKGVPAQTDEENWQREAPAGEVVRLSAAASPDGKAEIEFQNELRAVIKVTGTLVKKGGSGETTAKFPYSLRLTFWAGRAEVGVRHSLTYDADANTEVIRRIGLILPLMDAPTGYAVGGQSADPLADESEAPKREDHPLHHDVLGKRELKTGERISLLSIGPPKHFHKAPIYSMARIPYTIDVVGTGDAVVETLGKGDSPAGWMAATGTKGSVSMAMRDFWRLNPKEFSYDPQSGALTAWLFPDRGNLAIDLRRYSPKKVYEALNPGEGGRFENAEQDPGVPYGRAIGHELLISFLDGQAKPKEFAAASLAVDQPLYVLCRPSHYAASEAVGSFAPYDPKKFPRIEGVQDLTLEWIQRNQRNFGWYGMLDYGNVLMEFNNSDIRNWGPKNKTWLCRGYSGWIQNDGQFDHSLYVQALRRGDRRLLRFAETMTRHVAEVCTAHLEVPGTGQNPGLGQNDNHGRPRIGGVNRHNQHHWGDTITSRGTVTHGSVDLYNLTGDQRMVDLIHEVAQLHMQDWNYEPSDTLGLARFYTVLGDPKLQERAAELLDKHNAYAENFVWYSNTLPALWFYGQLTGDAQVKQRMIENGDAVLGGALPPGSYNNGVMEVYAWLLSKDRKYLAHLPDYVSQLNYRDSFKDCDLRRPELKDGFGSVPFSRLWYMVESFQPVTPEKVYHLLGHILRPYPVLLMGVENEDFLGQ